MITPRQTRLVRAAGLHAFRRAAAALSTTADIVVVPTTAAGRLFTRALQADGRGPAPLIATRPELYEALQARLENPPRRLTPFEREAIAHAAAAAAAAQEPELAFQLRPGLIAEMLRFYDQLRRQGQHVDRFEQLISEPLIGAAGDRGASRLLVQTKFLARAFREYEARTAATGACDEHMLRERLLAEAAPAPVRRILVTVGDWIAEPNGLFVADFDLLARLPGLESIDLISTDATLASGLHERIHSWWPGLDEVNASDLLDAAPVEKPRLLTPASDSQDTWFTCRDREEELMLAARRFRECGGCSMAVVFKRPLPYLYLAPDTIGAAGVPFESFDALPLAAEPVAAALDGVLDAVESGFTRSSLVALLRSPHFQFAASGAGLSRQDVSALDRSLSAARYLGGIERLESLQSSTERPLPGLTAALAAARELEPLAACAAATVQLRRLIAFCERHFVRLDEGDAFADRDGRARGAILDLLAQIADAHAAFHDPDWTIADLAGAVRRWISEHTFTPPPSPLTGAGVSLLDDEAARYGSFDELLVVGLVENEWPEPRRRNIFYGAGLLKALGWPTEKDRRASEEARFLDLIASARAHVMLATFTLDDDTLVARSPQIDDVPRARLSAGPIQFASHTAEPDAPIDDGSWAQLRAGRTSTAAPEFHGSLGAQPSRTWSVSALETYIGCPFRFFAQHVLRLEEDPDDEEVMDPRRQGQLVHKVFEAFFSEWHAGGGRSIAPEDLPAARALFTDVVERALATLPDGEAGLERTRLLGSPAAAGLGEAVFRMEAERTVPVVDRLIEERLDGEFEIRTSSGTRRMKLRGKADRIDLLADGTFRVIDYKLGNAPNRSRALQLPIYALCAQDALARRTGKGWTLSEAAYLAFKGPRRVVPLFSNDKERDGALADAQQRLADIVDAIERGEFPPRPDDVFRCELCSFTSVCRKDYV